MVKVRAKLSKLSICECGFLLMRKGIPIGEEYTLDLNQREKMGMICGGCGKIHRKLDMVFVEGKPGRHGGFLPITAFDLNEGNK